MTNIKRLLLVLAIILSVQACDTKQNQEQNEKVAIDNSPSLSDPTSGPDASPDEHPHTTKKEIKMNIEKKEMPARVFLSAKKKLTIPEIPAFANEVTDKLIKAAEELELVITGPSEFIYFGCTGNLEEQFDLQIAFPIEQKKKTHESFEYYESPAFICISQDYKGCMKNIGIGWNSLCEEARKNGIKFDDGGHVREVYKKWIDFDSEENITELQIEIK